MAKPTKASRRKSYFGGNGNAVLAEMKKRYGPKQGEKVFYATIMEAVVHGTAKERAAQPKVPPGMTRAKKK